MFFGGRASEEDVSAVVEQIRCNAGSREGAEMIVRNARYG